MIPRGDDCGVLAARLHLVAHGCPKPRMPSFGREAARALKQVSGVVARPQLVMTAGVAVRCQPGEEERLVVFVGLHIGEEGRVVHFVGIDLHVASMSRGAAASQQWSLKHNRNILQHTRHKKGRH
jgi:hypothetical protein